MALDNYENLKASIIEWSHRRDVDLLMDDFIELAETEMYANSIEPLQLRGEEATAAFTMDSVTPSRFLALPTGYQSMRRIRVQIVNGESYDLRYSAPTSMHIVSSAGMPCYFTVTSQIELDRFPDDDYEGEIQYIKEFTPLSTINPTNTVLDNYPTIYKFGVLWALYVWAEQPQNAEFFYQRFINAIHGANQKDKMGRYGPAPVIIVEGPTP